MQEHKRTTETEEEKLVLPARPSSLEGAAEEGAGRKRDLSVAQIREWVEVYRAGKNRKFPSCESGQVLNADGSQTAESWGGLDALFNSAQKGRPARGLRGIGFKSLADFLDKTYPDEREVRVRIEKPDLSIEQIKRWVDVYREANDGKFPSQGSGEVLNADGSLTGENWRGLDSLFRTAQEGAPARGLRSSGFESLPDFLDKTYPDEREVRIEKQDLLIEQIKVWVEKYRAANDEKFPSAYSGAVLNADGSPTGETWVGLDALFRCAQKGQPARGLGGLGFKSLRDFLDKTYPGEREVRIEKADLSIEQIKGWVEVYRASNDNKFPSCESGQVLDADGVPTGETWRGFDVLFRAAQKGFPARGLGGLGFKSLADFLDNTYPDVRIEKHDLSIEQIRGWVDAHRAANDGKFPSSESGQVLDADGIPTGETWRGFDLLFRAAQKGFPARGLGGLGFKSLADFLDNTYPDVRIEKHDLSIEQIRGWVDAHRAANDGKFPSCERGEIRNADGSPTGETWKGLDALFKTAQKGFPARGLGGIGFESLSDFLDKTYPDERKVRIEKQDLSIEQIKVWVDVYREANDGKFPSADSGAVLNADGSKTGETWSGLHSLFNRAQKGRPARGLGGLGLKSLPDFLDKTYPDEREVRIEKADLSIDQIKVWVDVYREANDGKFPSANSVEVLNADGSPAGERWAGLNSLFRSAQKGFPARGLQHSGFTSLSDCLDKTYPTERARERRAPTARSEVDDINVLLDLLE